jgi:hypothetical protein
MTAFVELRTLVAGALSGLAPAGDDWPVHEAPVDSVVPPCFALVWPDPWVTPQTVCTYTARLDVIVFAARIDPAPGYEELEELVAAGLPALERAGMVLEAVGAPTPVDVGGLVYQSARIHLSHPLHLGGP